MLCTGLKVARLAPLPGRGPEQGLGLAILSAENVWVWSSTQLPAAPVGTGKGDDVGGGKQPPLAAISTRHTHLCNSVDMAVADTGVSASGWDGYGDGQRLFTASLDGAIVGWSFRSPFGSMLPREWYSVRCYTRVVGDEIHC